MKSYNGKKLPLSLKSGDLKGNGNGSGRNPKPAPVLSATRGAGRMTLITGGAGFIGTNLAHRLMKDGRRVLILDNLSRDGVERNLEWLRREHGHLLEGEIGDVRDARVVARAVRHADSAFHFAAQVAVTTSLVDPVEDFDINVRGTLNLLEALRAEARPIPLIFTSTNKVYGELGDIELERAGRRYRPADPALAGAGVDERRPLDFHSPYGCSKGAADQYVLDYARSFGLPNLLFRMSCIYGPHQCGTEDQGWVAHFLLRALRGEPITLYGDGLQVRDILFVEDLVAAFLAARERVDRLAGRAFNMGGGPANTTSLVELIDMIGRLARRPVALMHDEWRVGDQKYYVSNTRRFEKATGWQARVAPEEGVRRLHDWLVAERAGTFRQAPAQPVARQIQL